MPQKKIELDWEKLNTLLQVKINATVCAELMGISRDTIERRIKEKFDCTFKEYAERKLSKTKHALVTKAINKALSGKGDNTMLIFCLKNLCGWADKVDNNIDSLQPIKIQYMTKNADNIN